MTAAPPRVERLPAGDPVLAYGPPAARRVVVVQPLFEELNRCRALVAAVCRALAARGIGCWLPDLPGTGDSATALEAVGWADWRDAVAAALRLADADATVAFRGGALLDDAGARRWRLSPVAGASLANDLRRTALAGGDGIAVPPALGQALAAAVPHGDARTVRLAGDERPCDATVAGPALWRRAEPAGDAALAARLAADIAAWLA